MEKELPRLQKTLAAAGVASRRACETLIAEGHVQVNGKVVRELGTKVDPEKDDIRVDGERLLTSIKPKPLYIMLNKPVGFTSTVSDPHAEHTVTELLAQIEERVYPVGRLDVDSEGLLLLTNDGEFANRLTHPRYHVPKLYRVRARGFVGRAAATKLAEGVELEDGKTAPAEVRYVEYEASSLSTVVEITLYEGRNRQVRRMFESVGNPVRQLTRIGFGSLRLAGLNSGTWRKLRPVEVEALLELAKPQPTPPKNARRPKPTGPYRPPYMRSQPEPGREQADSKPAISAESKPDRTFDKFEGRQPNRPIKPSDPRYMPLQTEGQEQGPPMSPRFAGPRGSVKPGSKPSGKPSSSYGSDNGNGKSGGSRPPYTPTAYTPNASYTSRPADKRHSDSRYTEDDDYAATRPLHSPARPATPYEKKIAKLNKAKTGQTASNSTPPNNGYKSAPNNDYKPAPGSGSSAGKPGPTQGGRPSRPQSGKSASVSPAVAAPDGSTNSAAGRKAGLPYVPRPKPGFNKFGRAKP